MGGALAGVSPKPHFNFAGRTPRTDHLFPQYFVMRRWEEITEVHHQFFPGHASQTLHIRRASFLRVQKSVVKCFLLSRRSPPWPRTTLSGNLIPRQEHLIVQNFLTREGRSDVLYKSFPAHICSTTLRNIQVAKLCRIQKSAADFAGRDLAGHDDGWWKIATTKTSAFEPKLRRRRRWQWP